MFRLLITLVLLTLVGRTSADNLMVDDVSLVAGGQQEMAIQLVNSEAEYVAFQFDLKLPDGISIAKNENDKLIASLNTERADDHVMTVKEVSTGIYRFICYSMTNATFQGKNGTLVNIMLEATASVGTYEGLISSVVLTEENSTIRKPQSVNFTIDVVHPVMLGDVNGDGAVDIADAVCIVNHVVGKATPVFIEAAADVNDDGDIDIADAVKIVNLIVGKVETLSRGL